MISAPLFRSAIARSATFLRDIGLLESKQEAPKPRVDLTSIRHQSYRAVYDDCFRSYRFDLALKDQALLDFNRADGGSRRCSLRYAYYDCPLAVETFEEFLRRELGADVDQASFKLEEAHTFREDYENAICSADLKAGVLPVRYDYEEPLYDPGVHPVSHVHFGFQTNVRVATHRVMTPFSFTLFIVRQVYPEYWKRVLGLKNAAQLCRCVRDSIPYVDASFWQKADTYELALH